MQTTHHSADVGSHIDPPLHYTFQAPYTGAPPQQPFPNQNKPSPVPTNDRSFLTTEPFRPEPEDDDPRKGQTTLGSNFTPTAPPASPGPAGYQSTQRQNQDYSLIDHDYISTGRPPPLTDHNYFMSVPVPDPQVNYNQSQGRPARSKKLPTRLQDYDLS